MSDDIKFIDYIPINDVVHYSEIEKRCTEDTDMLDYVVLLLNNFKCVADMNALISYVVTHVVANNDGEKYDEYASLLDELDKIKKNINYDGVFCFSWDNEEKPCGDLFNLLDHNKDGVICQTDMCSLFMKLVNTEMIIDKTVIVFVIICLQNNMKIDKKIFVDGLQKIDNYYK